MLNHGCTTHNNHLINDPYDHCSITGYNARPLSYIQSLLLLLAISPAMIPKSPQILANQARHLTISNYRMHFALFSLPGMDQKQLVKDSSPASVAVIITTCLFCPLSTSPNASLSQVFCLNPGPIDRISSLLPRAAELIMWTLVSWPSCPESSYLPAPSVGPGSLEVHNRCGLDWIENCHDTARRSVRHCRQFRARTDVCKH